MLRRDFTGASAVAAISLVLGSDTLDLERLAALLGSAPARPLTAKPPLKKVGLADVEAIEQATAVLRRWQFRRGGGLSHASAVAQFRAALPLLAQASTPAVAQRLSVAVADLGLVAGWASYDVEHHGEARRVWTLALGTLRPVQAPAATDLTVAVLLCMTHQALHLHNPADALGFVRLADEYAGARPASLSAATATDLAGFQAMCHGALGEAGSCDRASGQAAEHLAHAGPAEAALPWAGHVNAADLAARQGSARYRLALVTADAAHAARAVSLLSQAVDGYEAGYARSRAINLAGLAGARVLAGDLDAAVPTGHRAVEEIGALAVTRHYEWLRTLDGLLRPHTAVPDVAGLRAQIRQLVTAT